MISLELMFTIISNLLMIAFFAGIYVCTIKFYGKNIEGLKEYFTEKIEDIKNNFKEHLDRVEQKQDKHNNLIERMAIVEASSKSAHKRGDELSNKFAELEEKYYEHISKGN